MRSGQSPDATWTIEFLEELLPVERPALFTASEHPFANQGAAREWLDIVVPQGTVE